MKAVFLDFGTMGAGAIDPSPLADVVPDFQVFDSTPKELVAQRIEGVDFVRAGLTTGHAASDFFPLRRQVRADQAEYWQAENGNEENHRQISFGPPGARHLLQPAGEEVCRGFQVLHEALELDFIWRCDGGGQFLGHVRGQRGNRGDGQRQFDDDRLGRIKNRIL